MRMPAKPNLAQRSAWVVTMRTMSVAARTARIGRAYVNSLVMWEQPDRLDVYTNVWNAVKGE